MKHLEIYESWFSKFKRNRKLKKSLSSEQIAAIDAICKVYSIINYTINEDGSIDVNSVVSLDYCELNRMPLKFNNINGGFSCTHNRLTSLENGPVNVQGSYNCSSNSLTSLEGMPKYVSSDFICSFNPLLDNFNGIQEGENRVEGEFTCHGTPINNIYRYFRKFDKIGLFNEYDILRPNRELVLERFQQFLRDIGEDEVSMTRAKTFNEYWIIDPEQFENMPMWTGKDISSAPATHSIIPRKVRLPNIEGYKSI